MHLSDATKPVEVQVSLKDFGLCFHFSPNDEQLKNDALLYINQALFTLFISFLTLAI